MEQFLIELKEHAFRGRTAAVIENGTWAPQAGKKICAMLGEMKDMTILEPQVTIRSAAKESQRESLVELAKAVAASVK